MKKEFSQVVSSIATELITAMSSASHVATLTSRFDGFNADAAYDVAQVVHTSKLLGGANVVGRKIGFTNSEMWSIYGVDTPIWGYMYDKSVSESLTSSALCDLRQFVEPKIEPEIVIHFRVAPPLTNDMSEILACIDWISHGVEIVQSHFPNWEFQSSDAIADGGLHGALLIGKRHYVSELGANVIKMLEELTITIACNGVVRATGRGMNALGNPLNAVAHLIGVIARQKWPAPLRAGDIVTTGTLTHALSILPGERWTTELSGTRLTGFCVDFI